FFSSRRRHTRWPRDWSSDVCSSDLAAPVGPNGSVAFGTSHLRPSPMLFNGVLNGDRFPSATAPPYLAVNASRHATPPRHDHTIEIGRASCRERVYILVGAGSC